MIFHFSGWGLSRNITVLIFKTFQVLEVNSHSGVRIFPFSSRVYHDTVHAPVPFLPTIEIIHFSPVRTQRNVPQVFTQRTFLHVYPCISLGGNNPGTDFFSIRSEQSTLPYPLQTTKQNDTEEYTTSHVNPVTFRPPLLQPLAWMLFVPG